MKIAIAADHGGFELKEALKKHYTDAKLTDLGTFSQESVDYPDIAQKMVDSLRRHEADLGILVCGTGIGISIVANKVKGIRAALCNDCTSARLTRMHNDANVLALGGGVIGPNLALDIVDIFFSTEFSGEEKHVRRLSQVAKIEEERQ